MVLPFPIINTHFSFSQKHPQSHQTFLIAKDDTASKCYKWYHNDVLVFVFWSTTATATATRAEPNLLQPQFGTGDDCDAVYSSAFWISLGCGVHRPLWMALHHMKKQTQKTTTAANFSSYDSQEAPSNERLRSGDDERIEEESICRIPKTQNKKPFFVYFRRFTYFQPIIRR